MISAECHWSWI